MNKRVYTENFFITLTVTADIHYELLTLRTKLCVDNETR